MSSLQNTFKIASQQKLCPKFYRLCIDAPVICQTVKPGQFVHIKVNDQLFPFFRRPFSVYRAQKYVEIFYEVVGPGTAVMARMKKGDPVDVIGPIGRPFSMPDKQIKKIVMVAGGIGVAPFLIFCDALRKKHSDLELILLYGGRSQGHVYDMKEFKRHGCQVHVATNDGSVGKKGFVSGFFPQIKIDRKNTFIYTCGPNPMMAAVQTWAREYGVAGEAACEEVMACALGACLGCSIKTRSGYKTVCYDGPVFDLQEPIF